MLGHQRAGVYASRVRAAYWDGRNQLGEKVASGVYLGCDRMETQVIDKTDEAGDDMGNIGNIVLRLKDAPPSNLFYDF